MKNEVKVGMKFINPTKRRWPYQVSEIDEKGNKPAVKVGDEVLYGKYAGTEITVEGKEYLIMRESDILAILA